MPKCTIRSALSEETKYYRIIYLHVHGTSSTNLTIFHESPKERAVAKMESCFLNPV